MASSFDHQAWDPSLTTKQKIFIDHQAWDPPLTTKHGILPPPFSFSLKGGSDDWGVSLCLGEFPGILVSQAF